MKKRKNLWEILKIILILYFIVQLFITFFKSVGIDELKNFDITQFNVADIPEFLFYLFSIIVFTVFVTAVSNIKMLIVLLGVLIGSKKFEFQKLDINDLKKYKGYYRDILKEYNPLNLSFVDDFKVSNSETIIAELLHLEKNGYIKKENNELIVLKKDENLSSAEEYILDNIKDGKLNIKSTFELETLIQRDGSKQKIIKTKEYSKEEMKKTRMTEIVICAVVWLIFIIIINFMVNVTIEGTAENLMFLFFAMFLILAMLLPFIMIASNIAYSIRFYMNPYIRTKKGKELNMYIEGLKNYLKDYSMLDQKTQEDITLWDEYLIYSVLFGQNKKIIEEYKNIVLY